MILNMKIKLLIVFLLLLPVVGSAQINNNYLNKIADAIYKVEGGNQTKYPYGIKSINTHGDKILARKICLNTIKNNYKRWQINNLNKNFLDYLADVYCPYSVDRIGNQNWKKNIHKLVK